MALGTIATGIGAAGALYSGYNAYQSQRQANKAAGQYGAISSQTAGVMKKQYENYKRRYVPLENMFIREAQEDLPGRAESDAMLAGQGAYGNTLSNLDQFAGTNKGYGALSMASAEFPAQSAIGAYQGMQDDVGNKMNRQMTAIGLGRQIPGQVVSGMNTRANAALTNYQSAANQAQSYGQGVLGIPAAMLNAYSAGTRYGALG